MNDCKRNGWHQGVKKGGTQGIPLIYATLADKDINSILTDHANREILGNVALSKNLKIPNLLFASLMNCSDVISLFRRPRNEHGRSVASATFVAKKR